MSKPRAAIGLVLCLLVLTGFAARHRSLPRRPDAQPSGPRPRADLVVADLAEQTELLRGRIPGVAPALAPPGVVRDVFASVSARRPEPLPVEPPPSPLPPATPAPALTLVGIAEDDARGSVERTAVMSGTGDALYLVKSGGVVAGRYRVGVVGSDTAEIIDVGSGVAFTLALK